MTRLSTSFVLGYHGCDRSVAERAIAGEHDLITSDKKYDWLGPGAYFWEADPRRAAEWADWKVSIGAYEDAAVVGAVIDLRNCLDLVNREDLELLRAAHRSFLDMQEKGGLPVPVNKSIPNRPDEDRSLRFLDCAVIRHLHGMLEGSDVEPFDTVRGMFTEGDALYAGCGFRERSHVQLAIRNTNCILGLFWPRMDAQKEVADVLRASTKRRRVRAARPAGVTRMRQRTRK